MKFELMFSISRDWKRLILGGKGPHMPNETRESFFNPVSFVKSVNKESVENFWDKVCSETANSPETNKGFEDREGEVLFPMTVISVTCPFAHTTVTAGEYGR